MVVDRRRDDQFVHFPQLGRAAADAAREYAVGVIGTGAKPDQVALAGRSQLAAQRGEIRMRSARVDTPAAGLLDVERCTVVADQDVIEAALEHCAIARRAHAGQRFVDGIGDDGELRDVPFLEVLLHRQVDDPAEDTEHDRRRDREQERQPRCERHRPHRRQPSSPAASSI